MKKIFLISNDTFNNNIIFKEFENVGSDKNFKLN